MSTPTEPLQFGRGQCRECGAAVVVILYVFNNFRWWMQLNDMPMNTDKSPLPLEVRANWREHEHPAHKGTGLLHNQAPLTMSVPELEETNS